MNFSLFGRKLAAESGILTLMDDLARPLPEGIPHRPLGGGNPARIPAVEQAYRREMERLMADGDAFEQTIGRYDTPQGRLSFLETIAAFLRSEFGWDVGPENVAVTNGSQSAFFYLLNLFSGDDESGCKTILFPLVPEYIGYADQGIAQDTFVTLPARIEPIGDHEFKYHIDRDLVSSYLNDHPEVGAICVSRPTNPTGNVLTDDEITALSKLAGKHDIPLIIDNAYGLPFPNIIFPEMMTGSAQPHWNEDIILTMSLSKIGLPSFRTGIVIAKPEVVSAIGALNSIVALASGSLGQVLGEAMLRSGELKTLADTEVQPFYRDRLNRAKEVVFESFGNRPWRMHRSEGALFLWLYFEKLTISTTELYRRLKDRGVIVVPGEYFFFGREEGTDEEMAWKTHPHRNKCIRINYSGDPELVHEGIRIIAEVTAELEA